MELAPCPFPGSLRLRAVYPLIDRDGACSLVYDLERATVLDVPEDLQLHIAPALETGDLDEELLGWLVSEDVMTGEGFHGWTEDGEDEEGMEAEARPQLGPLLRCRDEIHGWIDQSAERAVLEALDLAFKRGLGAASVKLHLDWVGKFPGTGLLEQILVEACRRGALSAQEVSFELALDASQVTEEVARCLASYPIHLRLRCGECDLRSLVGTPEEDQPWLLAEEAVTALLACVPDQLTVQCVLAGSARLSHLWSWAKQIGIRSLDVIRLEEPENRRLAHLSRIREFRDDLLTVCDEMCSGLESTAPAIDFQPLTRIVRRLIQSEPSMGYGERADFSWHGSDIMPRLDLESLDPRLLPDLVWMQVERSDAADAVDEIEAEASAFPCEMCWARYVCSHSAFVASPLGGEDPREPLEERCAFWRAEVEVALRLYHRLSQTDPLQVLRLFNEVSGIPTERLRVRELSSAAKPS